MQSRVVEIDDEGPVRRRANQEEDGNRGPQDYPERDPLDLIEEDKRPFARRKLLATCCGGIRTVYDEVTAQSIHPALYFLQILTYAFYPGLILLSNGAIFTDADQRMASAYFVAAISFVVCAILQGISYKMNRSQMARAAE